MKPSKIVLHDKQFLHIIYSKDVRWFTKFWSDKDIWLKQDSTNLLEDNFKQKLIIARVVKRGKGNGDLLMPADILPR